jgi:hypothetical protein
MHKKDKREIPKPAWFVVFLIFAASAVWFYSTDQPFAAVIYIWTSFLVLRKAFDF